MSREDNAKVIGEPHGAMNGYRHESLPAQMTAVHRFGYQIEGEEPVYVDSREDYADAARHARIKANEVREKIRDAGVTTVQVSWWTQRRVTRTEVEYAKPQIGTNE